jgi:hypothetical protein
MTSMSARNTVQCLIERWRNHGLPRYAQFDNGTVFQGAHQFANAVGRISRLCLQLNVIPVFAPAARAWHAKHHRKLQRPVASQVWLRYQARNLPDLQARSQRYIAAHHARTRALAEAAPARRPMPKRFSFDLQAPVRGTDDLLSDVQMKAAASTCSANALQSVALGRIVWCAVK